MRIESMLGARIKSWLNPEPPRVTARLEDVPGARWRWLGKAIFVIVCVVGIALLFGWIAWDRLADRQYQAVIAQLRAEGFAVTPDDPAPPAIDPNKNGAVMLVAAAQQVKQVDGL